MPARAAIRAACACLADGARRRASAGSGCWPGAAQRVATTRRSLEWTLCAGPPDDHVPLLLAMRIPRQPAFELLLCRRRTHEHDLAPPVAILREQRAELGTIEETLFSLGVRQAVFDLA